MSITSKLVKGLMTPRGAIKNIDIRRGKRDDYVADVIVPAVRNATSIGLFGISKFVWNSMVIAPKELDDLEEIHGDDLYNGEGKHFEEYLTTVIRECLNPTK